MRGLLPAGGRGRQEGSGLCSRNFMVFMLWLNGELFSALLRVRTSPADHQRFQLSPPPRPEHRKALLLMETEMEGSKDLALVEEAPRGHTAVISQDVTSQHLSESQWERLSCVVTSWSMWTKRDRSGP